LLLSERNLLSYCHPHVCGEWNVTACVIMPNYFSSGIKIHSSTYIIQNTKHWSSKWKSEEGWSFSFKFFICWHCQLVTLLRISGRWMSKYEVVVESYWCRELKYLGKYCPTDTLFFFFFFFFFRCYNFIIWTFGLLNT
jgi:hypothetical protein